MGTSALFGACLGIYASSGRNTTPVYKTAFKNNVRLSAANLLPGRVVPGRYTPILDKLLFRNARSLPFTAL